MNISKINVPNSHIHQSVTKTQICLSATGSLQTAFSWANEKGNHDAPSYVIDRDGSVHRIYPSNRWANVLGNELLDRRTIHIALCNVGPLRRNPADGLFYPVTLDAHRMPIADTAKPSVHYFYEFCTRHPHHGFQYYEYITPAQISSLRTLLQHLISLHHIPYLFDTLTGSHTPNFAKGRPGIYLACGYDTHRSDLHPQPELINLLKSL